MRISTAYAQLSGLEREFVDGFVSRLDAENSKHFERLTVTLERLAVRIDFDQLDERSRDQFAKPLVCAAIRERVDTIAAERDLTPERLIKEHAAIGFASIKSFFPEIGEDGIPQFDARDASNYDWAAVQSIDVEETFNRGGTKRTIKIKMHGKQASLDMLAKWAGLDKTENPVYADYRNSITDVTRLGTSASVEQLASEYARFIDG